MIDITGPKVLVPTILFALLSPGFLIPNLGLLIHALLFAILNWFVIKFVFKFTLTLADLIVPALIFIMLTPGVILTVPSDGPLFFSGRTGIVPVMVHAVVFSIVWASTRGLFPQFY